MSVSDQSSVFCCKSSTVGFIICSFSTLILLICFSITLIPSAGTFFGLNYPEIYREKNWIRSLATINNITSNPYVCCEKICNQCIVCALDIPSCGQGQPSFLNPGDEMECCDLCSDCFGEFCDCCSRQMNRQCRWECDQCYAPQRDISFPLNTMQKASISITKACKSDIICMEEFVAEYQLGHKYSIWYNPDNYEEVTFSINHSWWKWVITSVLLVTPVLFLVCSIFTIIISLAFCTCLILLSLFTEMPEIICLSIRQYRKKKNRVVASPYDFDKHFLYPNQLDVALKEDIEMYRELLQASVHDWDTNAVRVWVQIMGWKEYKDLFKFNGADFLYPDYFNDSSVQLLTKEIFKGNTYVANLFFSAVRCLRLFMLGLGQSPPTLFWDFVSVKELLLHTGLASHVSELRNKKVHLFYLLEASSEELQDLFDAKNDRFGSIIREDFNNFVQRLKPDLDILKLYILKLSSSVRPSFHLVEQMTTNNSRISKTFRKLLQSRVTFGDNMEEEALLSDISPAIGNKSSVDKDILEENDYSNNDSKLNYSSMNSRLLNPFSSNLNDFGSYRSPLGVENNRISSRVSLDGNLNSSILKDGNN